MESQKISLDRLTAMQQKAQFVINTNLHTISQMSDVMNETAVQCIKNFDLPGIIQDAIISNARALLDAKDALTQASEGYKTISASAIVLYKLNLEFGEALRQAKAMHEVETKNNEAKIEKLASENIRLKTQSIWSFIRSKFK
ncbi:hypothetical protein AHMF7605_22540 [Adhaeribacter arboris]|uniref:Phasin domain-containing protein n=1 Tax=Adhaeribacter arboris TaxID=2072846 RepID=A0A2T2YKQ1_9BACT|nr:hypothetical protein [Adhaeribacter arboris]PSR56080.1 hypothetical protein AHMF7605_22540 [Adhaeribacter arboris]